MANTLITETIETDPLTLRMIAAKKLISCRSCNSVQDNTNHHPSKLSFCPQYPAMKDMVGCMNHSNKTRTIKGE